MTAGRTLLERLERLASAGVAGPEGRLLRAPGSDRLMVRLLAEIGETILPRRLVLASAEGRSVHVLAGNGRLVSIEAVDGFDPPEAAKGLIGAGLDAGAAEVSFALYQLFTALIGQGSQIVARQEPVPEGLDPARSGIAASALREAWQLPVAGPKDAGSAGDVIDSFLAGVQGAARAWLLTGLDGGEAEGAGNPDATEELEAFADARRETGEAAALAQATDGENWCLLALRRGRDAADVTVVVQIQDLLIYLAVPRDRLGAVADAWRRATGR